MAEGIKNINQKISSFKRKYYLNLLTRGVILAPAFALGYFLVAVLLEYNLWLGKPARFLLFILFVGLVVFCILYFFKKRILWWLYKKGLGAEESAKIIGNHFPSVSDKLLNVIQLSSSTEKNALLNASIDQKSGLLQNVSFEKAVDLSLNKLYLRYLLVRVAVILLLTFVDSNIFTKSTGRIVQFNQEFSPQAPFQFGITNKTLTAFFNEDFTLGISLRGDAIPESAYLISDNQRWKMEDLGIGKFQYVFEKQQHPIKFQIEASGFYSPSYQIELTNRPEVSQIKISLAFPSYTGKNPEVITNAGNIEIPEGTRVNWSIKTAYASHAQINFTTGGAKPMVQSDDHLFSFGKNFNNNDQYSISLENESSNSKDDLKLDIANQQNSTENKIDKSVQKAKEIKESINEAQQKLRGKQSLDWQDKKMLEELLKQKEKLDKTINDLQKENKLLEQKKDAFTEENQRIKEKSEQIQKLMDELLDDETKKLFNELEKLLKENSDIQQMQRLLEKMDRKEINLEKELERTLELFKELQYEYKLDQAINDLEKQAEKQENLLNDTKELTGEKPDKTDKSNKEKSDQKTEKESPASKEKKTNEDLAKEQNELQKDLKKFEESIEDLKKLGDELDKEEDTPGKEDFDQLENSEQQSKESLDQNNPKQSVEPQKKSLNKMKQMQKQLQQSQSSMQMEMS